MSIEHLKEKIKQIAGVLGDPDIFTALVVILVAFLSFGLGRLSVSESKKPDIQIGEIPAPEAGARGSAAAIVSMQKPSVPTGTTQGQFVASKNGTKYYFPWCSGTTRIKEENKVWFQTVDEAKKAGYQPSSTCKGL